MRALTIALAALTALTGAAPAAAAPGDLDRRFGNRGIVDELSPEGPAEISKLIPLPDGGFIAVATTVDRGLALMKYRANGRPDVRFGRRGRLIHRLSGRVGFFGAAARAPGGKLVVGFGSHGRFGEWLVARFGPDGRLDRSFGRRGFVTRDMGEGFTNEPDLVVQRDGRVVVALQTDTFDASDKSVPTRVDFLGFTARGRTDRSFGENGRTSLSNPNGITVTDMVRAPGGRILFAGSESDSTLGSLAADGRLERLVHYPSSQFFPLVHLVALRNGAVAGAFPEYSNSFVLKVFPSLGADPTTSEVSFGDEQVFQEGLLADPHGRIVVAGSVGESAHRFALARFLPSGVPDRSFGTEGGAVAPRGRPVDVTDVVRGPGDTILVAGRKREGVADRIVVARFRGR